MARPIVLITTSYPEASEGPAAAGVFVRDFAAELSRHVPVRVVAPALAASPAVPGGLSITRFAVPRLPLSTLVSPDPRRWLDAAAAWRAGARAVFTVCAETQPRALFALWALPSGAWARAAARRFSIPYATWALGSDIWSLGRVPLARGLLRRVLAGASRRYADGEQLRLDVERLGGAPCEFLPSSRILPVGPRAARTGGRRLAFLGRWHRNKGVDLLLEALQQLDDKDWQAIEAVRICGGGPLEGVVRKGVARLAAQRRPVELGGFLERDAAAALLGWADELLIPSRIESIPVVFSDAMQAGCRVIATPVGDLPALLGRFAVGTLAADVSPRAFASALRVALHAPAPSGAAEQRRAASEFSVGVTAARVAGALSGSP